MSVRNGCTKAWVQIRQIQSDGGDQFFNVSAEHEWIGVWGMAHKAHAAALLTKDAHYILFAFDADNGIPKQYEDWQVAWSSAQVKFADE
jgi:hypothetical protein